MLVHDDPARGRLDADAIETERFDVGDATRGQEHVRDLDRPAAGDRRLDGVAVPAEALDAAVREDYLDSLFLQGRLQLGRGLVIRPRRDLRAVVHDRHA